MSASIQVVIPARLESQRLPRKPLVMLDGLPMIIRTYQRCLGVFTADQITVATDSVEIVDVCRQHQVPAIITSAEHRTGTDRVAEVADILKADIIINVQGDEPAFDKGDLQKLKAFALENPDRIVNGYCAITSAEEHRSASVPKVVFDLNGRLLYMSRAPIPGSKSGEFGFGYRQVCAYAFPAAALEAMRKHPAKTPLENHEDIEILRFLELGFTVQMIEMSSRSVPVDHPSDIQKAIAAIRSLES